MKAFLLVSIGGFFGSGIRYLIAGIYPQAKGFPTGTLLVNIIASLVLGLIMGMDLYRENISREIRLLLATGFCGGFSTYSTFAYESLRLLQNNEYFLFFLNIILNTVLTIAVTFGGFYFAMRLTR